MILDEERRPGLATEAADEDQAKSPDMKIPDRARLSIRSAPHGRDDLDEFSTGSLASLVDCLFKDRSPIEREMGLGLRALVNLHVDSAHDGRCGSCHTGWPCATHTAVGTIVEQHIGVLASGNWS